MKDVSDTAPKSAQEEAYWSAFYLYLDAMRQDCAIGKILAVRREEGALRLEVLDLEASEEEWRRLNQDPAYEMVIFDGGNTHGDCWKATFFPAQHTWSWVDDTAPIAADTAAETGPQVSLDGGVSYQPAPNGVRIRYPGQWLPGEDAPGELHVNWTSEGCITDVWATREEPLDYNIGTSSETLEDIIERLVEED